MTNIYSFMIMIVFIAMFVSAYKFIKYRTDFYRLTVWACITVMVIILAVDRHCTMNDSPEFTVEQQSEFISTLRDTANELKKYDEVDEIYFSTISPARELEITLIVNDSVNKEFLSEIEVETHRIFLHALIDNTENLPTCTKSVKNSRGGVEYNTLFSNLKIIVKIVSETKKALPLGKGIFN